MCGGGRPDNSAAQAEADRQAAAAQAEADRIAAERQAAVDAQLKQQQEMEAQSAAITAQQRQQAAELQAQKEQQVAGIRAAGAAVTTSLQILGNQPTKQGPTAQMAKRPAVKTSGVNVASSLRMGPTANAAGAGANLPT